MTGIEPGIQLGKSICHFLSSETSAASATEPSGRDEKGSTAVLADVTRDQRITDL